MFVLGAMIQSRDATAEILSSGMNRQMFYRPDHQLVFETIEQMEAEGAQIDPVFLADRINAASGRTIGDVAQLIFDLISKAPTPISAMYHAERVRAGYLRRESYAAAAKIKQLSESPEIEPIEVVEQARAELDNLGTVSVSDAPSMVGDMLEATRDYYRQDTGRITWSGFESLDSITGGFRAGQMIIVAARPGIGKSTLALDFARNVARTDRAALMFSLEMSKQEVTARAISAECSIDLGRFTHSTLMDDEAQRLADHADDMSNLHLWVDDAPGITMAEIRAKARRLARERPLGLMVVDYIGLISAVGKVESRQIEIAQYSRALKMLAKELDCPVVVVVQLSRQAEMNGAPRLHHLRESGALEQDADKVLLLSRSDGGDLTVDLAKNRSGQLGSVELTPVLHYCRFMDQKWSPGGYQ